MFVLNVSPQGAAVYEHADNRHLGHAPWKDTLSQPTTLRVEKKGYATQLVVIDPNQDQTTYGVTLRKVRRQRGGRNQSPSKSRKVVPPPYNHRSIR